MRKIESCPVIESTNPLTGYVERCFEVEFITPLYGGGVEAGLCDTTSPIRAPAIRGHLRFWWRATRGASFPDGKTLKENEDKIWGSTELPSPVQIKIGQVEGRKRYRTYNADNCYGFSRYGAEAYALFPAQQNETPKLIKEGLTFTFLIKWPSDKDLEKDVYAAVWAWLNFGGIGARTRRGLGALFAKKVPDDISRDFCPQNIENFGNWLKANLKKFDISNDSPLGAWPVMPDAFYILPDINDALSAWKVALACLKRFRQGEKIGRDLGRGKRPGRSRWPEAESIRELAMEQNSKRNRNDLRLKAKDSRIPTKYFPRAEFGLPIIFEIRNENLKPTLIPGNNHERMASPLVLRPLRFSDGSHAALIYLFKTPPIREALLKPGEKDLLRDELPIGEDQIRSSELNKYQDSPMSSSTNTGSALEAFQAFILKHNFQKVSI